MQTHGAASAAGFEALRNLSYNGMGSFLIAAAALKPPTRNSYKAQGVNLIEHGKDSVSHRAVEPDSLIAVL